MYRARSAFGWALQDLSALTILKEVGVVILHSQMSNKQGTMFHVFELSVVHIMIANKPSSVTVLLNETCDYMKLTGEEYQDG